MPHAYHTTEDFATDESFQAFVFATDPVAVSFWQAWRQQHPAQEPAVQQAVALLQLLAAARPAQVAEETRQRELTRLLAAVRTAPPAPQPWLLRARQGRRLRSVAVLLLLVLASVSYWFLAPGRKPAERLRYTTRFGQQRTITLPDGSVVTLNANSTLETAAHWQPGQSREVWLQGEAYFNVIHKAGPTVKSIATAPAATTFRVHAGDLNVTVLGTKFNVNNRGEYAKVVLSSGKVQLDRRTGLRHEEVLLKPGEMAEYSPRSKNLQLKTVNPQAYSSWTDGYLTFDHSSMAEVIQVIRQTYGLRVSVTDESLLRQQLTGSLPSNNADVFLQALAKALRLEVARTGDTVQLRPLAD